MCNVTHTDISEVFDGDDSSCTSHKFDGTRLWEMKYVVFLSETECKDQLN